LQTDASHDVQRSAVPQTRALIQNHVQGFELLKIYIVNLILMVLTLGIYRFWGKTRLRRYIWGNLEIMGDRLEYSGTGKELFLGFLVVFFLILFPLFAAIGLIDGLLANEHEQARVVLGLSQGLIIVFLVGVAFFRARRYRLTRTHWRGIYSSQTGSSVKYGLMAIASYAATALTLGLAWPVCSVWLKRYEMKHTWVGDEPFDFSPSVKKLYRPFLVVWGIGALYMFGVWNTAGSIGNLEAIFNSVEAGGQPNPDMVLELFNMIIAMYLGLIPIGLAFLWYRGRAYNHFISSTQFHGHALTSTNTGFGFMWLTVGNSLLVFFTLGLALPWAIKRYLNFVERHVGLVGDGDFSQLLQSTQERPSHGEGLADAFDVGGI